MFRVRLLLIKLLFPLLDVFEEFTRIESCLNQIVKIVFYFLRFSNEIRSSLSTIRAIIRLIGIFRWNSSILGNHLPYSIHRFLCDPRWQFRLLAQQRFSLLTTLVFWLLILNVLLSRWNTKPLFFGLGWFVKTIRVLLCWFSSLVIFVLVWINFNWLHIFAIFVVRLVVRLINFFFSIDILQILHCLSKITFG